MGFSLQCSPLMHPGKDEKMVGVRSWLRFLCNRLTRILPIHYLITGVLLFKYTSGIMPTNGISLWLSILLELTYLCVDWKKFTRGPFAVFLAPPPSLSNHCRQNVCFFAGLECVGHSFAYVAHFVFLRDVWIRTQRAAVASRRATNLALHNPYICLSLSLPCL